MGTSKVFTGPKHRHYDRLVGIRDELVSISEQVPEGIDHALVGLNASIMRMCHHDRREVIRTEFKRYEEIDRVTEWVECPHCRAKILVSRQMSYTPIGAEEQTGGR